MKINPRATKEFYRMFINYGTGKIVVYDKIFLVAGDIRESIRTYVNEYLNMDYIRNNNV